MAVVQVSQVVKEYRDRGSAPVVALRGVDLTVEAGEFMALAGPSGSGKTTLLNLIGALDTPSQGRVSIDGRDLAGLSPVQLADLRRDRIGFVFQSYNLVPVLTAAENAEYVLQLRGVPKAERRKAVAEVFAALGIGELMDARPPQMSGGQQQRVAVARAIVAAPAVVLADEPTANLDQASGRALIERMHRLNHERGITFVFSTHDPMVLEQAERVVNLVDGQIASDVRKGAA
ncbi:MAG: ABC transporter ATP-binding protein [Deltaproteobacteria bacterium]|nr:ABC transporter ATP-binding protein [Deltaproteobacteria bacterium]